MDFCESPPIFLVQNSDDLAREKAMVEWDPPIFHDNSLKDVLGGYHQQLSDCLLDKSENYLRSFRFFFLFREHLSEAMLVLISSLFTKFSEKTVIFMPKCNGIIRNIRIRGHSTTK